MAETEVDAIPEASDSANNCDISGVSVSPKSPEDENSESAVSQHTPDLKSVLVTSVLNLEMLDVDLYR